MNDLGWFFLGNLQILCHLKKSTYITLNYATHEIESFFHPNKYSSSITIQQMKGYVIVPCRKCAHGPMITLNRT